MRIKTYILLLFVDMYGYFVNFYENTSSLHKRMRHHLKSNIFNNIYSSFGILKKSGEWVTCFDYENAHTFKLIYLYICDNIFSSGLGLKKTPLNMISWFQDELGNSKYCVGTLYKDDKKEETIITFTDDKQTPPQTKIPISNNIGYALLIDGGSGGSDGVDGSGGESNAQDITRAFKLFAKSLSTITINTEDFADILYYKGYVDEIIGNPNIIIMNVYTMEEHIFKAYDIITI